jgi:hypothetical protein
VNIEALIKRYPRVYHMAEVGTWPSIKEQGLLSTSALLDKFGYEGEARATLEKSHRREKIALRAPGLAPLVIRDQKPMAPDRLRPTLQDGLTVEQWYKAINSKVFFWAERSRLLILLNARHYRALEHDVLTVDTASLLEKHSSRVWLSPMNSGNTFPMARPRGLATFRRISDYPSRPSGIPEKEVVELVVDYAVEDVAQHVVEVHRMRRHEILEALWP